jgi:pyruvate dehydrogenase (quinone)
VLVEAITDPEVPPLPPHITLEEARNFMRALPHDPDRGAVIKESFKQKIEELIPGR